MHAKLFLVFVHGSMSAVSRESPTSCTTASDARVPHQLCCRAQRRNGVSRRQKSLSTRKAHTTSVHAKRQAKNRKRRQQRNSNPEAQRPLLRCAPRLAGESGPGASSSPTPHLTSATASGREIRSQEAKHAATAGSRAESRGGTFYGQRGEGWRLRVDSRQILPEKSAPPSEFKRGHLTLRLWEVQI